MVVFLEDQIVAVERCVELGKFLQRPHRRLDHEGEHADPHAGFLVLLVEPVAEFLELGDVAFVVIGDVRDHHPVAVQVGAGNLLDARERLALDRTELGEIDLRPRQPTETGLRQRPTLLHRTGDQPFDLGAAPGLVLLDCVLQLLVHLLGR